MWIFIFRISNIWNRIWHRNFLMHRTMWKGQKLRLKRWYVRVEAVSLEKMDISGTIVRHLILPGHTRNSRKVLRYLHETYGEEIYISIMNQYTPVREFGEFKELNRKVTKREYEKVLDAAVEMGIQNGFIQEGETASESFIPEFDYEGVEKNTP